MAATIMTQMAPANPPTTRTVTPMATRTALIATLSSARRITMAATTTTTREVDMAMVATTTTTATREVDMAMVGRARAATRSSTLMTEEDMVSTDAASGEELVDLFCYHSDLLCAFLRKKKLSFKHF